MHGDPAVNGDAFVICVCHTVPEYMETEEGAGKSMRLVRTIVDLVLAWEPNAYQPVDLQNVEDVMEMLIDFYGIRRVTFDRFNSAQTIQKLQKMGIDAEDMSFSNEQQMEMYRHLRLLVYNHFIEFPPGLEETLTELKFLKQEGNKITHDLYGKDRADAVAAATCGTQWRGDL